MERHSTEAQEFYADSRLCDRATGSTEAKLVAMVLNYDDFSVLCPCEYTRNTHKPLPVVGMPSGRSMWGRVPKARWKMPMNEDAVPGRFRRRAERICFSVALQGDPRNSKSDAETRLNKSPSGDSVTREVILLVRWDKPY